jgi:hypothetical protein
VEGTVESIAAVSPGNAWAVWRSYTAKGAIVFQPHVLHWNGSKWSDVSVPGSKGYLMDSVAASSAGNVWLFGETKAGAKVFRWDGTQWHAVSDPSMVNGATVVSASNAWSLEGGGCATVNGQRACTSYLWHSNGKTWAYSTFPQFITGIGGTAASGVYIAGVTKGGFVVAYRWSGSSWTLVSSPHPKVAAVLGIAVTAGDDIWISVNPHGNSMYALHWDGAKWTHTANVTVPQTYVGSSVVPDGHGGVWLGDWHWNGKSWADNSAAILYSYAVTKVPDTSGSYWAPAFTPMPAYHAGIAVYGPLP